MLIQKAYEQGRILESSDLTDEALFRLLREDEVVRALATRVVENRFYVRAKPARQEIEGKRPAMDDQSQGPEPGRPTQTSPTSDQVQRAHGREDDDWSEQQRNTENHRRSRPGVESPLRPDRDPEISVPRKIPLAPWIALNWNRIPIFSKIWEAMPAAWLGFIPKNWLAC